MSNDQQLSKEKSLEIIHQMIGQAKTNITDSGVSWIVWGTMLFLTSLSTYIFIDIGAANIFMGWNVFGLLTIVLMIYDVVKPKRKKVKTYIDDLLKWVDIGFIVSLFLIIFAINVAVNPNAGFGFFLMIFAFVMLIKGGAIRSWELKYGAVINFAGAVAIFLNKIFKYDMLIMACAILIGFILPGILLWRQHKKLQDGHK